MMYGTKDNYKVVELEVNCDELYQCEKLSSCCSSMPMDCFFMNVCGACGEITTFTHDGINEPCTYFFEYPN